MWSLAATMLVFLAGSPGMALDLRSPPQPPKGKAMLDNVYRRSSHDLYSDVNAPGIPGWKPWYGVGPVVPSKTIREFAISHKYDKG